MSFDPAAFLDEFRAEANEHLRALDRQLLALERDPSNTQPIRQMFLSAHTIKGGAAMLELNGVRELAHALEDVLAQLRQSAQQLDPRTADLLFQAVDGLRTLVDQANPGDAPAPLSTKLAAALRERAGQLADRRATPAPETGLPRALVVEDSATVRLVETMVLSDVGFQVDAVGDGDQALAMAGAASYQLVVTGLQNRGADGLELLVAMRGRAVPVIVTSSNDDAGTRRRAAELGAHAFLAKGSLSDTTLAATARKALQTTTHADGGADA